MQNKKHKFTEYIFWNSGRKSPEPAEAEAGKDDQQQSQEKPLKLVLIMNMNTCITFQSFSL